MNENIKEQGETLVDDLKHSLAWALREHGVEGQLALREMLCQALGVPAWIQHDNGVLIINGRRYSEAMFSDQGLHAAVGTVLRIEAGPDECVTASKIGMRFERPPLPNTRDVGVGFNSQDMDAYAEAAVALSK